MEDIEDSQDFDEDALLDVVHIDSGENYSNDKNNESFA